MECLSPITVLKLNGQECKVPCGRCATCKVRRVNTWAFRIRQEEIKSSRGLFVTFTYSNDFVPISENGFMTLKKSDFQDFMKRLRYYFPDCGIKYFCVGEYGGQTYRPHFHAIMLNLPSDVTGKNGKEVLETIWENGSVHIGYVTQKSIAYCLKYIDKPPRVGWHSRDDRIKEFALMSKGIGRSYAEDKANIAYHKADLDRMCVSMVGLSCVMPRYYRDIIFSEDEKEEQVYLCSERVLKKRERDFERYLRRHSEKISFEEWYEMRKEAINNKFYNNQKQRK